MTHVTYVTTQPFCQLGVTLSLPLHAFPGELWSSLSSPLGRTTARMRRRSSATSASPTNLSRQSSLSVAANESVTPQSAPLSFDARSGGMVLPNGLPNVLPNGLPSIRTNETRASNCSEVSLPHPSSHSHSHTHTSHNFFILLLSTPHRPSPHRVIQYEDQVLIFVTCRCAF